MNDTTCKDCGKPIHWVEHENRWYHDDLLDMWSCTAPMVSPVQPAEV